MFEHLIAEHDELRAILDRMPALLENGVERNEAGVHPLDRVGVDR